MPLTPHWGHPIPEAVGVPPDGPGAIEALALSVDDVLKFDSGPVADIPDPDKDGQTYWATDVNIWFLVAEGAWQPFLPSAWEAGDYKDVAYVVEVGSEPPGWLLPNGREVSRTTYATLFAKIGTRYGAGNGTTTFNLPDWPGRTPVCVGTHSTVDVLGDNDGLSVGSRSPRHVHTVASHVHTTPNHSHSIPAHQHWVNIATGASGNVTPANNAGAGSGSTSWNYNNHQHWVTGATDAGGAGTTGSAGAGSTGAASPATDSQGGAFMTQYRLIKT